MLQLHRREFLRHGLAAGAVLALPTSTLLARSANETIHLGFISCGGRANELLGVFQKLDGVAIAGLCDPDQERLERTLQRAPAAKTWTDPRGLLDDKDIDAVVIATCNHWHCLAAIWAMQAGKDVYVEKPLSHSQWEGRQTVAAARKYDRICQVGTQQRSDPMQAEIKKFLHDDQSLGKILSARVNRYGVRAPIGKRDMPLAIPSSVNYDIWLGPAADKPIYRDQLQYDWHWDWNTGSGEMGNWGVHVLDDCRNIVFRDQVNLPRRVLGGGGRVVWNDAGETPNIHFVYFDTPQIPVVIGLTNLTAGPGSDRSPQQPGPGSGYIAYCEGGKLEGMRGRAVAFDADGNKIKDFRGNSGNVTHQQNFIDAVRAHDRSLLNAEVEVGHFSTGWCNLANIAYRCGKGFPVDAAQQAEPACDMWCSLVEEMTSLLQAHNIDPAVGEIQLSPMLELDVATETFIGAQGEAANPFLKREYREPFVVPELES